MKKLCLVIIALVYTSAALAAFFPLDSVKQQQPSSAQDVIASLKTQLDTISNDSVKVGLYARLAAQYLRYDSISNKKVKHQYQNEALDYSYKALHLFSRYDDTVGMRNSFDNLATVYHSQKIYPQAKWFILQSNTFSRAINDVPNIMKSLIKLAAIKMDIKDYSLAMRDLNEALKLSINTRDARAESNVQLNYALLYNRMKNYAKGNIALKRHNFIDDSIRKSEALLARNASTDSADFKKKVQARKIYRPTSSKKIAAL